jgi:tetratricopeptide (TPR) repeat protein
VNLPDGTAPELYQKATRLFLAGKFAQAEAAFKDAIAVDKGYAAAYRGLGILYEKTGSDQKAIEALKTYLKLSPNARDADKMRSRLEKLEGGG